MADGYEFILFSYSEYEKYIELYCSADYSNIGTKLRGYIKINNLVRHLEYIDNMSRLTHVISGLESIKKRMQCGQIVCDQPHNCECLLCALMYVHEITDDLQPDHQRAESEPDYHAMSSRIVTGKYKISKQTGYPDNVDSLELFHAYMMYIITRECEPVPKKFIELVNMVVDLSYKISDRIHFLKSYASILELAKTPENASDELCDLYNMSPARFTQLANSVEPEIRKELLLLASFYMTVDAPDVDADWLLMFGVMMNVHPENILIRCRDANAELIAKVSERYEKNTMVSDELLCWIMSKCNSDITISAVFKYRQV